VLDADAAHILLQLLQHCVGVSVRAYVHVSGQHWGGAGADVPDMQVVHVTHTIHVTDNLQPASGQQQQ
jgi:hypothetical protein